MSAPRNRPNREYLRAEAIATTRALVDALEAARGTLTAAAVDARVFAIPTQAVNDEDPPTTGVRDVAGAEAIRLAIQALCDPDYGDNQHPMATRRRPGVLAIDPDHSPDLIDQVRALNALKQALRRSMQAFGARAWYHWRGQIPLWRHFNRLQAYRRWHALENTPRQLGVSWAGHAFGHSPVRIAQLMRTLRDQDRHAGHPNIEAELDRLAGFDPNEVVAIRRPIAPHPMLNFAFPSGARRAINTSLPLIVPTPLPPKIGALGDFRLRADRSEPRDDSLMLPALNAHTHAYRYQPAWRFWLPADPEHARLRETAQGWHLVGDDPAHQILCPEPTLGPALAAALEQPGPVKPPQPLDAEGRLRLVATTRKNAYLVHDRTTAWSVPLRDLDVI